MNAAVNETTNGNAGEADGEVLRAVIGAAQSGARLDRALAGLFSGYSRSFLQECIRQGRVLVDGSVPKARDIVSGGEQIAFRPPAAPTDAVAAEPLPLAVVHEDADLLVIDKPPGQVVHPAAGHRGGTVLNALLHRCPQLAALPRGGIVHRLDKGTSGLMAVAKTHRAHQSLVSQLQARTVKRRYLALVCGRPVAGGEIAAPVGRHPRDRKRMAVRDGGRAAVTRYRIARRFAAHTLLDVELETGRTHQIRVHLAHIGYPVFGDPVYGGRFRPVAGAPPQAQDELRAFTRQALHAAELSLLHPATRDACNWRAEPPDDLRRLLALLEQMEERNEKRRAGEGP